jgi:hypothetical protein
MQFLHILYAFLHLTHPTHSTHLIILDLIILLHQLWVKIMTLPNMQFLHSFWYSCQICFLEYPKLHTHIKWYLKNGSLNEINIEYNKLLSNPSNLKFLGIIIDNSFVLEKSRRYDCS